MKQQESHYLLFEMMGPRNKIRCNNILHRCAAPSRSWNSAEIMVISASTASLGSHEFPPARRSDCNLVPVARPWTSSVADEDESCSAVSLLKDSGSNSVMMANARALSTEPTCMMHFSWYHDFKNWKPRMWKFWTDKKDAWCKTYSLLLWRLINHESIWRSTSRQY